MAAASLDTTLTLPAVDSLGAVVDSLGVVSDSLGVVTDSLGVVSDSLGLVPDSLGTVPVPSDSAAVDSIGAGRPAAADTAKAPSREDVKKATTYPLEGAADTTGARK